MERHRTGDSCDRGAAAVEFALVVPVLLLLVFGIMDYGLFFTNSLGVRQGVREAARQGVVANYGSSCSMTFVVAPSPNLANLACTTVDRTGAVAGSSYVKIKLPNGWVKGEPLIVCEMVQTSGLTGFVPMPDGGVTASKVQMSVEKVAPGQVESGGEQAPPSGHDWAWC